MAWTPGARGMLAAFAVTAVAVLPASSADDSLLRAEPTSASTTTPATAPTTPPLAADVRAALDALSAAYVKPLPLAATGTISVDFDVAGIRRIQSLPFTTQIATANKWRHEVRDEWIAASDGTTTTFYSVTRNLYEKFDQRPHLAELDPALQIALAGNAESIEKGAAQIVIVSDGILATYDDGAVMRFAVDPATGLLRSIVIDYAEALRKQGATEVHTAIVKYEYTDLKTRQALDESAFAFVPPAGARELKEVAGGISVSGIDEALKLEGQPAPAFTLEDLAGKPMSLSDLKGRVVVIDFWASWCPPCVEGMPHLNRLAHTHRDAGLTILAINVGEDADTVKAFLTAHTLTLPVLMDSDLAVSEAYFAHAFPQTVVIGRDGVVRKVIVGLNPSALDAALAEALRGGQDR